MESIARGFPPDFGRAGFSLEVTEMSPSDTLMATPRPARPVAPENSTLPSANSPNFMSPSPTASTRQISTLTPDTTNGSHQAHLTTDEMVRELENVASSSPSYVESLYQEYVKSPENVDVAWREYFRQIAEVARQAPHQEAQFFRPPTMGDSNVVSPVELEAAILQERVDRLIRNYRAMGHYAAIIDPLGQPREPVPELDPASCDFSPSDLDRQFSTVSSSGPNVRTLREILQWLRNTYCRSIGAQFMHIDNVKVREWLQDRMESSENRISLTADQQKRILKRLSDAVVFEDFILRKFQGAKSFSLEGGETLIPLLELAINKSASQGVEEIILGMAHRGRLNVLASIMGKPARAIFREFADLDPQLHLGRGDVKYHLGYSNDYTTADGKKVHLSLCFNPSHLEFVNTVALGRVRAKQDRRQDVERRKSMALLIHGDAAFAGEGITQEMLNLSELESTRTGGTVHVIVNNQIGFTTPPHQGRSTAYATDVAKMLQIPIFHVNGEDPEAVAQVVELAMDFRCEFQRDVVIDMYCYRLRGHNEQDEPRFTNPGMYKAIDRRQPMRVTYSNHLTKLGGVTQQEADELVSQHKSQLESEYQVATASDYQHRWEQPNQLWKTYRGGNEDIAHDVPTGVPVDRLKQLLEIQTHLPDGFKPHPKIQNILDQRRAISRGEKPVDWGAAEILAYASLLTEKHPVRLHGQDCERGTFAHRHAVVHDIETGAKYVPLQHLTVEQARFQVYNSALSETGVLGFDYGFSLDCPDGLTIWEAQFGDFVNVAQVIIDQFITSAEDKWNRYSGLTMLLPHGFEGAGPEHSSARLERFLEACAEDNIQVCYPTTAAQMFHMLRRQVLRHWRKPLVVMTPKYYLRSPQVAATLDDLANGSFQRIYPDVLTTRPDSAVQRILMCTGKIYHELAQRRQELGRSEVAIIRVEQLYPLPTAELQQQLSRYAPQTPVTWVQEEPENMGAWRFILAQWGLNVLSQHQLRCVSRPASASPATGSKKSHEIEQERVLSEAFGQ